MTADDQQRIAVLENEMKHLNEKLEDTHAKVTVMHDLLMQAKGARWFIVGMAAIAGFGASFLAKLFPFMGQMPK